MKDHIKIVDNRKMWYSSQDYALHKLRDQVMSRPIQTTMNILWNQVYDKKNTWDEIVMLELVENKIIKR